MLQDAPAFSSFSVNDVEQAKTFYSQVLGLVVTEAYGGLSIETHGNQPVMAYPKGAAHEPATFTVLNFTVDNLRQAVTELAGRGVSFEQYNNEYIKTDEQGIAAGDGKGPQMAWFKDPSGNILALMQTPPA
jgi:predicted enzyme related to lactoylglutathione lyase